jgi:hypothetical protein
MSLGYEKTKADLTVENSRPQKSGNCKQGTIYSPVDGTLQNTIATMPRRNSSVQPTVTTDVSGKGGCKHGVSQAEIKKRPNETGQVDDSPGAGDDGRKKKSPRVGLNSFGVPNHSKGGTNQSVQGSGQPDRKPLVSTSSVQEFCYKLQMSVATQCHSFMHEIGKLPVATDDEQLSSASRGYAKSSRRHDSDTLYRHGLAHVDNCDYMPPSMMPHPFAAYCQPFVGGLPAYYGGQPTTVGAYPWQHLYPTEPTHLSSAPSQFHLSSNARRVTMPHSLNSYHGIIETPKSPFTDGSGKGNGYRRVGGRFA